jgi:hypothetical protein
VGGELQRRPHVLVQLAENSLTVAQSLRENYFHNTARFIGRLRLSLRHDGASGPLIRLESVADAAWADFQDEIVTFIDGGFGRVEIASQAPILLRVGSYSVRTGERRIAEREQFGYYPVILGDLEGGSKGHDTFPDLVRIVAELLGGLVALERTPDLRVLVFHGPLVYQSYHYAGHTPFTERDIDLFLRHYAPQSGIGDELKSEFLREAAIDIYPEMSERADEWVAKRLFEPLAFIAYLYRRMVRVARARTPVPVIMGVVERGGRLREFSEAILLKRIFRRLREREDASYFNRTFKRTDLTSPKALLDRLGYTDTLLLSMLLNPGEFSEPWEMSKHDDLKVADVTLPGESAPSGVDYGPLRPGRRGLPRVLGAYLQIAETIEPVRIEVFRDLGAAQMLAAAQRAYLYSRLLPGYGFPVGLDIADKYARVPAWMMDAYSKTIRYHLGVGLQQGDIGDAQMRRIIVQALYMKGRDWLFRPPGQSPGV